MNVWVKFDDGKQKYRSQNEVRCAGAGLRMNEGLTWAPGTWEKIVSAPACAAFTRMNESSQGFNVIYHLFINRMSRI